MITNQQREEAYDVASDVQKTFYASPETGEALREMAKKHQLGDESKYTIFVLTVGDVILDLLTADKLGAALTDTLHLEAEQAAKVVTDVRSFLGTRQTETATAIIPTADSNLTSDIAQNEAFLKAMPGMRTMSGDMNGKTTDDIPTYTSTQEAILKEGRLAQESPEARWGQ